MASATKTKTRTKPTATTATATATRAPDPAPPPPERPYGHGGRRPGAGRKRTLPGPPREPHRARPPHDPLQPVHVVLQVAEDIGSLRRDEAYAAVRLAMIAVALAGRRDFRMVHVSIQRHHVHLLVEADDAAALANGVRALGISLARRLNALVSEERGVRRRRRAFADRYRASTITSPREARHALVYVLNNWRRHGEDHAAPGARRARLDRYASGSAFAGWAERDAPLDAPPELAPLPTAPPMTWLLQEGWQQGGPAPSVWEVPAPLTA